VLGFQTPSVAPPSTLTDGPTQPWRLSRHAQPPAIIPSELFVVQLPQRKGVHGAPCHPIEPSVERLQDGTWRFTWIAGTRPYTIWLDGEILTSTLSAELFDFVGGANELLPPPIEILSAGASKGGNEKYPPFVRIQWRGVVGAAAYIIERFETPDWVETGYVLEKGKGYYVWTTEVLIDKTTHQHRVTALSAQEVESTPVAFSFDMVRNPEPPDAVTVSILSTGELLVTDPATGDSPLTILGSRLKLWLDASDSLTITSDSNGVSQWNDKSGNASHVAQSVVGFRPTVSTAAVNGLDAILFGDTASERLFVDVAGINAFPFKVMIVVTWDDTIDFTGNLMCPFSIYDVSTPARTYELRGGSFGSAFPNEISSQLQGAPLLDDTAFVVDQAHLIMGSEQNSFLHEIEVDGGGLVTSVAERNLSGTWDRTVIGVFQTGARRHSGLICEVLVIDETLGAVSAAELAALETYLERWGLTIP